MLLNKKTTTKRTTEYSAELDRNQMIDLLRASGADIPEDAAHVRIYFAVPGGGDWSNISIDIDSKNPVYVEWKTTEERDA